MSLTVSDSRTIILSLPEVEEHEHWGRPAFRVNNKIFATLWPNELRAVLKLTPEIQQELIAEEPEIYSKVAGAWCERGYTNVNLEQTDAEEFASVAKLAWRLAAPKRVVITHGLDQTAV